MPIISPPECESYYALNRLNFYRHTTAEWRQRNYVDLKSHKVDYHKHADWETPWDYVNNDPKRKICRRLQDFFMMYNFPPSMCRNCWKVVVKPQKHSELIKLRDIQRDMATDDPMVWCKCGTDLRSYVPGIYGGYFYTDSKDAGLDRLDQVRKIVRERIGNVSVILKRYCTEYEIEIKDSIETEDKLPVDHQEIEKFYLYHLSESDTQNIQPAIVKLEVYQGWMDFGWKFGTPEDRKEIEDTYNNGKPLHIKPRTYERSDFIENVQNIEGRRRTGAR